MTVIDSARRCPRDGKRLVYETGQHEDRGDIETAHYCLNCDWRESHNQHVPVRRSVGRSLRSLLDAMRLEPETLEIAYDTTPFPEIEWDESEVEAVR